MGGNSGSREPNPQAVSALSGFDPGRVAEMIAAEEFIAAALTDAYQRGKLHYVHYSPAHDATVCRMVALSLVAEEMAAQEGANQ